MLCREARLGKPFGARPTARAFRMLHVLVRTSGTGMINYR